MANLFTIFSNRLKKLFTIKTILTCLIVGLFSYSLRLILQVGIGLDVFSNLLHPISISYFLTIPFSSVLIKDLVKELFEIFSPELNKLTLNYDGEGEIPTGSKRPRPVNSDSEGDTPTGSKRPRPGSSGYSAGSENSSRPSFPQEWDIEALRRQLKFNPIDDIAIKPGGRMPTNFSHACLSSRFHSALKNDSFEIGQLQEFHFSDQKLKEYVGQIELLRGLYNIPEDRQTEAHIVEVAKNTYSICEGYKLLIQARIHWLTIKYNPNASPQDLIAIRDTKNEGELIVRSFTRKLTEVDRLKGDRDYTHLKSVVYKVFRQYS